MAVQFVDSETGEVLEPNKRGNVVIDGQRVHVHQGKRLKIAPVIWTFVLLGVFLFGGTVGQSFAHDDAEIAGCDLDAHTYQPGD